MQDAARLRHHKPARGQEKRGGRRQGVRSVTAVTARPRRWQWPAETATASRARRATRRALDAWQLEQLRYDAALVVSELVANACLHGGGPVTVVLRRTQKGISGEVGDALPSWPAEAPLSERHGLRIVLELVGGHLLIKLRPGGGKLACFDLDEPGGAS